MRVSAALTKMKESWLLKKWYKIVLLLAFILFFLWYPGQNYYSVSFFGEGLKRSPLVIRPTPAPYPINKTGIYPGIDISATSVVVQDAVSGVYLFRRASTMQLPPASTTKILSALVVLDSMDLDEVVTVGELKNDGQTIGLVTGEKITVENLLYGMLIQSGNDAGYALANAYPGGLDAFIASMNKKAADLHLEMSHFTNPVGYDDPSHYMTAEDLVRLADVALQNKILAKMVAIPQITISDVTHTYFHRLSNVNQLLGKIPGVAGIKTGWTEEAGENLVTLVERGERRIIIVVLHSQDRFGDTIRLIDWAFGNYEWQEFKVPS
jgi:D-alanyl-D-alanine carboxypeptidase (penicillin-binding protein 5/6)